MPRACIACSIAAVTPAGTSTELRMNGTVARTSCDGVLTEIRGDRVCGAANG